MDKKWLLWTALLMLAGHRLVLARPKGLVKVPPGQSAVQGADQKPMEGREITLEEICEDDQDEENQDEENQDEPFEDELAYEILWVASIALLLLPPLGRSAYMAKFPSYKRCLLEREGKQIPYIRLPIDGDHNCFFRAMGSFLLGYHAFSSEEAYAGISTKLREAMRTRLPIAEQRIESLITRLNAYTPCQEEATMLTEVTRLRREDYSAYTRSEKTYEDRYKKRMGAFHLEGMFDERQTPWAKDLKMICIHDQKYALEEVTVEDLQAKKQERLKEAAQIADLLKGLPAQVEQALATLEEVKAKHATAQKQLLAIRDQEPLVHFVRALYVMSFCYKLSLPWKFFIDGRTDGIVYQAKDRFWGSMEYAPTLLEFFDLDIVCCPGVDAQGYLSTPIIYRAPPYPEQRVFKGDLPDFLLVRDVNHFDLLVSLAFWQGEQDSLQA